MLDRAIGAKGPRLELRRHLRAEIVPGDGTYLIAENATTRLSDPRLAVLVPLLDGTRDLDSICREIAGRLSVVEVGQLVGKLIKAGFARQVQDGAATAVDTSSFWDLAGLDGSTVQARLARSWVPVVATAGTSTMEAMAALGTAGLRPTTRADADAQLVVVLTTDYLAPELSELVATLTRSGQRWLPARLDRAEIWLGPIVGADGGACWTCVSRCLQANRLRAAGSSDLIGALPPASGSPLTRSLGAHQLALAVSKSLAGLPVLRDEIVVHDTTADDPGQSVRRHPVRRWPQCPDCGDADLIRRQVAAPVRVEAAPKSGTAAAVAGERTRSAQATYEALRHLVDPVTGVVPELRREPGVPAGMHVYRSGLNVATTAATSAGRRALRHLCGGKGATESDARTGALCEALERYSGQLHGDEPRWRGRFVDLPDAIHPNDVLLFHQRQYARAGTPGTGGAPGFDRVPEPFDRLAEIDWTPVWSLTSSRHRLLPTAMLYYDIDGVTRGGRYVVSDSNGNAAGNHIGEAVVQGFCELVERDAVAIWWYNRTRQAGVDLDTAGDPWLADQRTLHDEIGRELLALDLTTDLGIPVIGAVSYRRDAAGTGRPADICLGFGAHFNPRVAARRAVAEVAQLIPAALPGDGHYATDDPQLRSWWQQATPVGHPYLTPDPTRPIRSLDNWPYRPRPDVADDVSAIVELCAAAGLELLVLDQTRPDIGLSVVKVVVPGLRHFWQRFAPGRLYDVPVALERVSEPCQFDELNPHPIFL